MYGQASHGLEGLSIGEKAPAFDYMPVNQNSGASVHFEPEGKWSLLVFADPGCVSCKNTIHALERLASKLEQTVSLLVVTSAESALVAASDEFRITSLDISRISSDVPGKLYRTRITPFGYLIDSEGMIRAKGIAADESSIRKIIGKVDSSRVNVEFTVSQKQ